LITTISVSATITINYSGTGVPNPATNTVLQVIGTSFSGTVAFRADTTGTLTLTVGGLDITLAAGTSAEIIIERLASL